MSFITSTLTRKCSSVFFSSWKSVCFLCNLRVIFWFDRITFTPFTFPVKRFMQELSIRWFRVGFTERIVHFSSAKNYSSTWVMTGTCRPPGAVCTQASRKTPTQCLRWNPDIRSLIKRWIRSVCPSLLFTIATGREQMHPQPVQQTSVVLLHMPIPESRKTRKCIQGSI